MDRIINQLYFIREGLNIIQRRLDFEDWDYELYPQFATQKSLGRTALLSLGLGIALGIHFTLLIILTLFDFDDDDDDVMLLLLLLWQWCFYVCTMCIFHLLEFFTTAIYNPLECSGDSFLVNQSKAYTAAALISATEFWLKFTFRCWLLVSKSSSSSSTTSKNVDVWLIRIGVVGVFVSQYIRFISMKTCGESFNHKIQTSKKENHTLINTGIYAYLRHPSYVGFYYWSISTQLVLTNYLSTILFAIASWMFFKRRIPYEEESLVEHFPNEYPLYAQSTYVGIPFIPNLIDVYVEEMKQRDNDDNNNQEEHDDGEGVEVTDTTTNYENDHHNNHKKEN